MKAEWENLHSLIVEEVGTLPFNVADESTGWLFQLDPSACSAALPVRVTDDDRPQDDGAIPHRRFRSGYGLSLNVKLLTRRPGESIEAEPACGADLVGMLDLLGLYVNAMIRTGLVPGSPNARLSWSPSGFPDRMFDRLQLASVEPPVLDDGGITVVQFDLDSPLPYYMSVTETQTSIGDGETATITNGGNTDFKPVLRVYGSFGDGFTVVNNSVLDKFGNPLQLVYDATLPGAAAAAAPDYIEIIFGLSTAYLNGDEANMKSGLDLRVTNLFPLVPGANELEVTILGADSSAEVLVLSNDAWA